MGTRGLNKPLTGNFFSKRCSEQLGPVIHIGDRIKATNNLHFVNFFCHDQHFIHGLLYNNVQQQDLLMDLITCLKKS